MKVKLLTARATATRAENVGDIVEVSADEAKRMFASGTAEPVRSVKPEKATAKRRSEKAKK